MRDGGERGCYRPGGTPGRGSLFGLAVRMSADRLWSKYTAQCGSSGSCFSSFTRSDRYR